MQRYFPVFAASIISFSIIYTIIQRRKRPKNTSAKKIDPSRPQTSFQINIRDNHADNSNIFYTDDHYKLIASKLESIPSTKLLDTQENVDLKPFFSSTFAFIDSENDLKELTQHILNNHKTIGIDIEQTNIDTYQGYNCLIQISCLDRDYIIDAIALHDKLPPYLKQICENQEIVKIFYSGASDLLWLLRDYGVFVVNYFDVHSASNFYNCKKDCSLVGLLKEYCNYTVNKATKKGFQLSDWRKRPLTQEQLDYAALDAHYLIYLRKVILEQIKKEKDGEKVITFLRQIQMPCLKTYCLKPLSLDSLAGYFDDNMSIYKKELRKKELKEPSAQDRSAYDQKRTFLTLCKLRDDIARRVDTNPELVCPNKSLFILAVNPPANVSNQDICDILKQENNNIPDFLFEEIPKFEKILKGEGLVEDHVVSGKKREVNKTQDEKIKAKLERKRVLESISSQKDIYEDCKLIAPDGEMLCYTNRKKIAWYLYKGIGTLVQEEPPIIQLKFEPSNRGYSDMRDLDIDRKLYVNFNRENHCVNCGNKQGLSRYHVVPLLYRQHFPLEMKAHRGHDVLLMCERCLEKANRESARFKDELAKRYGVPLTEFQKPQHLKVTVESIKKTLRALKKHKEAMPNESKQRVKADIRAMFESICNDEGFEDGFREQLKTFEHNKHGQVKLKGRFYEFFTELNNTKAIIKKQSQRNEFKNIHGKLIIEKLKTEEALKQFIEEWRMFFIDSLDPQCLPYDWHLALNKRIIKVNEENGTTNIVV